jgi:acyl carrier protein
MLKQDEYWMIESKIKELLMSELNVSPAAIAATSSATPLLGRGVGLDSVETMALVLAIEEEFNISIPDTDLNVALFQNIETLAKYVFYKGAGEKSS